MSPVEQSRIIAASVRAALKQVIERGQHLPEALELGLDRAIGNNAAQAIALAEEGIES